MSKQLLPKARILVVDDEPLNVRLLERMLDLFGGIDYRCTTDPREAVSLFAEFQPDLVLTDLHMPHLDGIQLIREIRAKEDYRYVPILLLTTESQAAKKQEAKEAGATGWIVKPFVQEKLLEVVQKVIR